MNAVHQRIGEITATLASLHPSDGAAPPASIGTPRGLFTAGASGATTGVGTASFESVLSSALQGITPATEASTSMTSDGIPTALAAYGNGLIPASALAEIPGSSERMWAPAAQAVGTMIQDAAAQGVVIGVTDGYRDYDSQVRVAAEKGLYREGGLAAVPGTSQHGWGLAVDVRLDATAQAWMREHAGEYGFTEAVAREPWHWEYTPPSS